MNKNTNIVILEEYKLKLIELSPSNEFNSNSLIWQCNCGNTKFYLTPSGPYCPKCNIYFPYPVDE